MLKVGDKVKLKKYKDYENTETNRKYTYTDLMIDRAQRGEDMYVDDTQRNGLVRLRTKKGDAWNFDISDIQIAPISLENK